MKLSLGVVLCSMVCASAFAGGPPKVSTKGATKDRNVASEKPYDENQARCRDLSAKAAAYMSEINNPGVLTIKQTEAKFISGLQTHAEALAGVRDEGQNYYDEVWEFNFQDSSGKLKSYDLFPVKITVRKSAGKCFVTEIQGEPG